jgi:hypothetical protein
VSQEKSDAVNKALSLMRTARDPHYAARSVRKILAPVCEPGDLLSWEAEARRRAGLNAAEARGDSPRGAA